LKKDERKEVERFLDDYLDGDILPRIGWILAKAPLSDIRDVALGYVIGEALAKIHAIGILTGPYPSDKVMSEVIEMLKLRIPKILEKVERETERISAES
jgi:hypothetical protein